MWRPAAALLLAALAVCGLAAPPRLHPVVRQEFGSYKDCDGSGSSFRDIWIPCAPCSAEECAENCCRAETGENQTLVCALGGCCFRRVQGSGGNTVFVSEALTASVQGDAGVCADLKASDSCDACAYLVPANTVGKGADCPPGYTLPPSTEDFSGTLACSDGSTTAPKTTPAGGGEGVVTRPPGSENDDEPVDEDPENDAENDAEKDTDEDPEEEPVSGPQPVEKDGDTEDVDDDGAKCFPGDARVHVEGVGAVPMRDLRIGDSVLVGAGTYSPVFMFTHRLAGTVADFLEVSLVGGASLRLTPGHFLHANGALVAARKLAPGDALVLADGAAAAVAGVRRVRGSGLYNPQTLHGDVVVDGVIASTFTEAVAPAAAHAALAPLRAAFRLLGLSSSAFEAGGGGLHALLPRGEGVY